MWMWWKWHEVHLVSRSDLHGPDRAGALREGGCEAGDVITVIGNGSEDTALAPTFDDLARPSRDDLHDTDPGTAQRPPSLREVGNVVAITDFRHAIIHRDRLISRRGVDGRACEHEASGHRPMVRIHHHGGLCRICSGGGA